MLRTVFSKLADRCSRDGVGDAEESRTRGFLPSRLDASVLVAHGMGIAEVEREISAVKEQAEALESLGQDR